MPLRHAVFDASDDVIRMPRRSENVNNMHRSKACHEIVGEVIPLRIAYGFAFRLGTPLEIIVHDEDISAFAGRSSADSGRLKFASFSLDFPRLDSRGVGSDTDIFLPEDLPVFVQTHDPPRVLAHPVREFLRIGCQQDFRVRIVPEEEGRKIPRDDFRFSVPERNGDEQVCGDSAQVVVSCPCQARGDLPRVPSDEKRRFLLPCVTHEFEQGIACDGSAELLTFQTIHLFPSSIF